MATRSAEPNLHGILLVDKPAGWTSHDVVARVRRFAAQRQVGHTGTLDPMATGLLVVCLGKATRLAEYMTAHDKTYVGAICFGAATTTDDAEGEITATALVPPLTDALLRELESRFTGLIEQVPPMFSAVKVAGQRAYVVARKGGVPALAARTVTIHEVGLERIDGSMVGIRISCSTGTYVRSLARDMALAAGTMGHLASLRRTRAGRFDVADAAPLETLGELARHGLLGEVVRPLDEGVWAMEAALLRDDRAAILARGGRLKVPGTRSIGAARVYNEAGEFVAIGAIDDAETLRPLKVLTL